MVAKQTATQVGLGLAAVGIGFEVFSSFTSSPWTMENFGADEQKANSAKAYVAIAACFCEVIGMGYSMLAGSWWPFIGTTAIAGMFIVVYMRALARGKAAGNAGWENQPAASVAATVSASTTKLVA